MLQLQNREREKRVGRPSRRAPCAGARIAFAITSRNTTPTMPRPSTASYGASRDRPLRSLSLFVCCILRAPCRALSQVALAGNVPVRQRRLDGVQPPAPPRAGDRGTGNEVSASQGFATWLFLRSWLRSSPCPALVKVSSSSRPPLPTASLLPCFPSSLHGLYKFLDHASARPRPPSLLAQPVDAMDLVVYGNTAC